MLRGDRLVDACEARAMILEHLPGVSPELLDLLVSTILRQHGLGPTFIHGRRFAYRFGPDKVRIALDELMEGRAPWPSQS